MRGLNETVSGSSDKKNRRAAEAQGPTSRQQKRQEEEKAERRSMMVYTVTGIVVAVLAVFLVVWNTGVIQRSMAAVTINGVKYNAAAVQYYYNAALSRSGMSSYGSSMEDMVMNEETGETFKDYLMDQAVDLMVTNAALADKAKAEGYTLSQEGQASLDSVLASLESNGGYANRKTFLRSSFGPYMTYDNLVSLVEQEILVSDYTGAAMDAVEYGQSDYDAYYQEHKDDLDSYTLTQFVFQASVPAAEGEERTEEETKALLEEAKTQKKAQAEELMDKLKAGEDPEALAGEYDEELYSSNISETRMGASSSAYGMSGVNSAYSEWAFDAARKEGDVTLSEYDGGSTYNYYVVRFEERSRDDSSTNNVRHILVSGDGAQEKAQALLDQWKSGEATEDSFAALARTESEDSGSAADGGLITNVHATSSYVESFRDWANDPSRKEGDTGLVESDYGWHVMYYAAGDPVWRMIADDTLRSDYYSNWVEEAQEGYEAVKGPGMKFVM